MAGYLLTTVKLQQNAELICKAALFFYNRCEAIIIQMRRRHITCNKELSADAMMDRWSWIFMLSAAVDKQLALFFPSRHPSWLSLMAAGAEGQSLVFSRVRWLDCCCKQGTGEASRCHCQCVGLNKASVHTCGVHAQVRGNTKRHSRVDALPSRDYISVIQTYTEK